MSMAQIAQTTEVGTKVLMALAAILTLLVMLAVTATILGIDLTPLVGMPRTYVPGPGGDPTYLPPAR